MKIVILIQNKNDDTLDELIIFKNKNPFILRRSVDNKKIQNINNVTTANGFQIMRFLNEINISDNYRYRIVSNFGKVTYLLIELIPNYILYLDYKWNYRALYMILKKAELEYIMSWLSTLGGAFSSLGDDAIKFANIAGKISVRQFNIAITMGDPITISRCKLYYSISLIQRGILRKAKYILRTEYKFALTQIENDHRLVRMCLGIWEKLKYAYKERNEQKLILKN